jgi:hypothetical protein
MSLSKNFPKRFSWIPISIATTIAAAIIGCGGSGGKTSSTNAATKAGIKAVAIESYQSLGGGMAFPNKILRLTAPANSGIGPSPSIPTLAKSKFRPRTSAIEYNPILGLYEQDAVTSAKVSAQFFTDSAGTNPAGTMTATSSSGSFSFATYPVTISASIAVTGGALPISGNCKIVYQGPSGNNSMTGTFSLPTNQETATINMTLSPTHAVGGSVTIVDGTTTIQATNIQGNLDGVLTCSATVQPGNFTGSGTLDFDTMQVSLVLNSTAGKATASVNSSGNLAIVYPDGSTEVVTNPISAALNGESGGTTSTTSTTAATTGSTATTTTGSTSTTATTSGASLYTVSPTQGITTTQVNTSGYAVGLSYAGSSIVTFPNFVTNFGLTPYASVVYVNGSGAAVGTGGSEENGLSAPLYWSNVELAGGVPTGVTMQEYIPDSDQVAGISDAGVVLGTSTIYSTGAAVSTAIYWKTPTGAPAFVKVPAGLSNVSISASARNGGFVGSGYLSGASTPTYYYWTSPTTLPIVVKPPAGVSVSAGGFTLTGVNNSGQIVATNVVSSTSTGWYYSGAASNPTALTDVTTGSDPNIRATAINNKGVIGGSGSSGAVIWTQLKPTILNKVATQLAGSSPWIGVRALNDNGQIVAYAIYQVPGSSIEYDNLLTPK